MKHPIDILFVRGHDSTKGLSNPIRKAFGSTGVSIHRIEDIKQYKPRRPYPFLGAVLLNFDDRFVSNNSYQKSLIGLAQRIKLSFPSSPFALRSDLFDPQLTNDYEENELYWRELVEFDFALPKKLTEQKSQYTSLLLRNAFGRYSTLKIGELRLNYAKRALIHKNNEITFQSETFDTLLILAKKPWEIRTLSEIHRSHITPPSCPETVSQRIFRLRQYLREADFPELIEIKPRYGGHAYRFTPPSS
ncbi:MAG: hypothetical protein R3D88_02500 [Alphaproteobacteria bacterium]|nr:hypothetical protein [Alphaproteobacteria bacterium]